MSPTPITAIDLNLLKVLHALAIKGQMTVAGNMIGLSQPAMSHALKRLRAITGDELFIRTPQGLAMTSFCESILPHVRRIMAECEGVFHAHASFDPATSTQVFSIGMNDYFSVVLTPLLVPSLQAAAPQCTLEVLHMPRTIMSGGRNNRTLVQDYLDDGHIDLAVMTADNFPSRFICEPLYAEKRVCIMAASNPASREPFSFEAMLALGHVKVTSSPARRGWVDERLDTMSRRRAVVTTVPHFSAAVAIVSRTNLVAVMPESVAKLFEKSHDLILLEPPFPHDPQLTSMIWLRSKENDAANRWLRETIASYFPQGPAEI
jgi:DNA-binding transcriptional LysR family regulator